MICEKCGKEFPQDEKVCPYCSEEETVLEQTEITEEVATDLEELGTPVSKTVRKKRGTARVVIGIIALVLAAAALVVSFWKPISILGEWKLEQNSKTYDVTGNMVNLHTEENMTFKTDGILTLVYTGTTVGQKDPITDVSNYTYSVEKNALKLKFEPTEEQVKQLEEMGQSMDAIKQQEFHCSITPGKLSFWTPGQMPRQVFDYFRVGYCYPSMYLWMGSAVLFILGVLLLAIPGKKYEVTIREEDEEEAEDLDEFLEDIYEEIEAEDEACVAEETAEEEVSEVTE